jgi:monovalent cation/hydrogen antiporter
VNGSIVLDLTVIFLAILVLVSLANRIGVAYPIVLVLGGIAIGYIPGIPPFTMPPAVVLTIFLPPLLYWESVTAPTSEFFSSSGLTWILQLAFGLVIVTTIAVAAVAHALIPEMAWGSALVLGAIVSSTDEVAFAPIVERIRIPRHVIATIEGESLINDATSLVLYAIGITAVVTGTFSLAGAVTNLIVSVIGAVLIGLAAAFFAVLAWHLTKDDALQSIISLMTPFLAYLPASHFGFSGVLAVVTTGLSVTRYTPVVLTPRARERVSGFWVTIVFMLNAFIFVFVGMQFHRIIAALHRFSPMQLTVYAVAICAVVVVVRLAWVFAQGLLPQTNEPEHEEGKADWSHVAVLAWSGMRGGISLAAALAIPLETAAGPFPQRDLTIFLTFCVLLATLVGQGGTLPYLLRRLHVTGDDVDLREARLALAHTAQAALRQLDEHARRQDIPADLIAELRERFTHRVDEFASRVPKEGATRHSRLYSKISRDLLNVQRAALLLVSRQGRIDNTVLRRVQRLLDLQEEELDLLESAIRSDIDENM